MKTWIWPLSWLFRIQELESTVAALAQENKDLVNQLAAESIANSSAMTGYVTVMEGIIQRSIADYKRMAEWKRQDLEHARTSAELKRLSEQAGDRRG